MSNETYGPGGNTTRKHCPDCEVLRHSVSLLESEMGILRENVVTAMRTLTLSDDPEARACASVFLLSVNDKKKQPGVQKPSREDLLRFSAWTYAGSMDAATTEVDLYFRALEAGEVEDIDQPTAGGEEER